MKASWYAEALYGALGEKRSEGDLKKIIARFRAVIAKRGHERLLPLVMREFEKIIAREKSNNEVVLVTADSKSANKWSHAYDHYEKEGTIPKSAKRRDVVDETIIGGFQIRSKNILIDGSYKRSLAELYKNIIS